MTLLANFSLAQSQGKLKPGTLSNPQKFVPSEGIMRHAQLYARRWVIRICSQEVLMQRFVFGIRGRTSVLQRSASIQRQSILSDRAPTVNGSPQVHPMALSKSGTCVTIAYCRVLICPDNELPHLNLTHSTWLLRMGQLTGLSSIGTLKISQASTRLVQTVHQSVICNSASWMRSTFLQSGKKIWKSGTLRLTSYWIALQYRPNPWQTSE